MNKYYYLGLLMILLACHKDRNVNFDYHITVEDYYTKQALTGATVIMKYCDGASFVSGRAPCDSVDYSITDAKGAVDFSGKYERGFGRGHEFLVIGAEGYPTTTDYRFAAGEEQYVIPLKPLVYTEAVFSSALQIDSLVITLSTGGYRSLHFKFNFKDSLSTTLTTIPDQHNSIGVMAFRNDTVIKYDRFYFTPTYQDSNKVEYEIK